MNITKKELKKILPVIISDLKYSDRNIKNEKNIKRELFYHIVRLMFEGDKFYYEEKETDGSGKVGLYIKGYVRDIWDYLDKAYDLIHDNKWI